ncbi:MAG TPA: hypothetical protein DEF27_04885 [Oscillatoriales bacterium UBA8482]|nr:hypothetical protein [Oscillatoriales bacterium UBA8482]
MSNLTNPPGGGDPPDRFRNVGEQIQSFFDFAENNPDRAVPFFVNIWETQASLTTRALALQGLGVAAKHDRVKEAFADWDVLKDIAKEVKGKGEVSNDLTRWAAASALEAIGYSQQSLEHLEGGGFTESLDRIRREIRDRKLIEINRIPRLNTRGETTAEYERHLEFWLYGPADELLNDNDSSLNYQDLIGDVISKLHGRGVYLGLISPNRIVQGAALRQARLIFKESTEIEDYLYGLLEEFLLDSNHEISLRIHAAEIINTATDINRRLKTLSQLLLEETELRNTAVRLLNPYKQELARVESDAYTVLGALNFEYKLDKPEPKDLTIAQIENRISSANQYESKISEIFINAMALAESLARRYGRSDSVLKQFLQNKQDEYLSDIVSWVSVLRTQRSDTLALQNKIKSSQSLLEQTFSKITNIDRNLYQKIRSLPYSEAIESNDSQSYNQYEKLLVDLKLLKTCLVSELNSKSDELLSKSKEMGGDTSWALIWWGLGIIAVGCFINFQNFQSQGSRSNSYTTTAWYASGFPKNSCGSSSSPNNCWYPVFIKYSDNNWNTVISNYCGDIGQAQSPERARELGQIQVASFGDSNEAQGFANYMQGWVGQQKCY